jgi:hypothetical protein
MFEVTKFAQFAGNAKNITSAKTGFLDSKIVTIVGDVRTGKTSFVQCIVSHFGKRAMFHHLSKDVETEAAFSRDIDNFLRRKVCVTTLCQPIVPDAEAPDADAPRYVVVDDLDILLAYDTKALVTSVLALVKKGCRFIITLDTDSARKYKLKHKFKSDSLMLYLDAKIETAVMKRWAKQFFEDALTDDACEAAFCKAMAAASAADGSIADMLNHFHTIPNISRKEKGIQWTRDGNNRAVERIFTAAMPVDEIYRAAESTGGSMLWQNAWQNAMVYMARKKGDYLLRLEAMIRGVDLEHQGHMAKDRVVNCMGITAAIYAWSNVTKKVSYASLVYSNAIGNGGARALEKKNLAARALSSGVTIYEISWFAAS